MLCILRFVLIVSFGICVCAAGIKREHLVIEKWSLLSGNSDFEMAMILFTLPSGINYNQYPISTVQSAE